MHAKPRIEEYYLYTSEKEVVMNILDKHLKSTYKYSLDIGCGNGLLSEKLEERSNKLHLCEINPFYEEGLRRKFPKSKIEIAGIQDVTLDKYDFILFSQALYYHPEKNWHALIDKLMDSLEEGGELFIILNSDQGDWWKSVRTIWEITPEALAFSYIPSTIFIQDLVHKYDLEAHSFSYPMNFPNFQVMKNYILKSCLPLITKSEAIERKLSNHLLQVEKAELTLSYYSELIILRKKLLGHK